MAAGAPIDVAGQLKITQLIPPTNATTNSNSAAFDVSPYVGTLAVIVSASNSAGTSQLQPIIRVGGDNNASNANIIFANGANFAGTGGLTVVNVDLRSAAFSVAGNKFMYLGWLYGGAATPLNQYIDGTVVGQQKYSG
jgi:hypothetical protein